MAKLLLPLVTMMMILMMMMAAVSGTGQSCCSKGFMSHDLLVQRAQAITAPSPPPPSPQPLLSQFWLIPGMNFTCNTTLNSITLAVDVHTATPTNTPITYPQILFYEPFTERAKIAMIVASYDVNVEFNSEGVYQLHLDPPLEVQEGYMVGVWGSLPSDSPVTLYYVNDSSAPTVLVGTNKTESVTDLVKVANHRLLVSPDIGDPTCANGFLQDREIITLTKRINSVTPVTHQVFYPDIGFSCAGRITKWLVGAFYYNVTHFDLTTQLPHLQIWRQEGSDYVRLHDHNSIWNDTVYENVFESVPNGPVYFQEGDFLGIYQFANVDTLLQLYAQTSSGPLSKVVYNSQLSDQFENFDNSDGSYNNQYVLVTVEIECNTRYPISTSSILSISISTLPSTSINTPPSTSVSNIPPSTTPPPLPLWFIVCIITLLLLVLLLVLVILMITYRCLHYKYKSKRGGVIHYTYRESAINLEAPAIRDKTIATEEKPEYIDVLGDDYLDMTGGKDGSESVDYYSIAVSAAHRMPTDQCTITPLIDSNNNGHWSPMTHSNQLPVVPSNQPPTALDNQSSISNDENGYVIMEAGIDQCNPRPATVPVTMIPLNQFRRSLSSSEPSIVNTPNPSYGLVRLREQ